MHVENPDRNEIKQLLETYNQVAVVGLSDNPDRTSHMIAKALQQRGYQITPVNPNTDEVLGEKSYATLTDIPHPIEIVDVFRRSEHLLPIAKEAVEIGAKVLWMQSGIINEEAAAYAQEHGLTVIMDRCIKVEDAILLPNKEASK
ncbi:CoA-binding protein [Marinicrinis sediminis]|uniref:CoA-binding protein n=1 Tax=Marinicrinis sediminis TaxID=1652465 RepID=A0ABW5R6R3_9BACL